MTEAEKTGAADDTHDMAVVSTQHRWQKFFDEPVARVQIHAHRLQEFLLAALDERLQRLDTCVVYDDCHIANVALDAVADVFHFFSATENF